MNYHALFVIFEKASKCNCHLLQIIGGALFQDQTVEECFLTVFEEINAIRPLKIDHGGVWSNERDPIGKQVSMVDNSKSSKRDCFKLRINIIFNCFLFILNLIIFS